MKDNKRWLTLITITNLQFIFSNSPEAPTYIWSIYLSVDDTIYQILCFLYEFPKQRVIANKEAEIQKTKDWTTWNPHKNWLNSGTPEGFKIGLMVLKYIIIFFFLLPMTIILVMYLLIGITLCRSDMVLDNKTCFTLPILIEVHVQSQENEQSCICVLGVSILTLFLRCFYWILDLFHFFRNACTKSGSLRFSQFSGCWLILSVYILMSFDFPFVRLFWVR
jgi:hypothetical protein